MGGGGGSTPQPYDELGGQFASFSGGTPSGPNWGGIAQDIGTGLQQFSQGMGRGQTSPGQGAQSGMPFPQAAIAAQSYPAQYIPTPDMQQAIMRLLGGYV